jgi:Glycosyl hydrolases family 18
VDKYDLDGIDLDFEGEDVQGGPFTQDDNVQYSAFVNNLCDSLHSRGKLCTIDSYSGNDWGAPKPDWWSSWKDKIDAIHTMGYTATYWSCPTDRSYQGQQDLAIKAGIEPQKLLPGLPMWVNNWAGSDNNTGTSNTDNLNYILNCLNHPTGITLWDIHAPDDVIGGTSIHPWTSDTVWQLIKAIHDGQVANHIQCPAPLASAKIIDDMSNLGINLKGGVWSAFSDNWSRAEADQANSTRVLTPDRSFDLALQYGTYGDIIPGYIYDPVTGQELKSIIKTFGKAGTYDAEGGFLMNLLPVDRSLDTTAQAWEIEKVGVERDLSPYNKLVVGAQCTSGKKIRLYLITKEQLSAHAAGYGSYFTCSGNYEDYELSFASLKPIWGSGPTGFDAAHTLRLSVEYVDPAPPSELILNIAGVATDTSVLSIKRLIPTTVVNNPANQLFWQVRSDGIYFNSAAETMISLYSLDGRLLFSSSCYGEQMKWGSNFPPGIYFVRIQRGNQTYSEKAIIAE